MIQKECTFFNFNTCNSRSIKQTLQNAKYQNIKQISSSATKQCSRPETINCSLVFLRTLSVVLYFALNRIHSFRFTLLQKPVGWILTLHGKNIIKTSLFV